MSFNADKCSVMHIGHNNMQCNYNISNQQLPTTDQRWDLGIIITKDLKWQKQTEKLQNAQHSRVHCPQFQVQKQRTEPPIIQIHCPPTSQTFSSILVTTFKANH